MIGKTIAHVIRRGSTELELVFTDGSSVLFAAEGWEVDDLSIEERTPQLRRQAEAYEIGRRERERVAAWAPRDPNLATVDPIVKEFLDELLRTHIFAQAKLLNRQEYGA
jgi:hypothetical protein